MNQNPLWVIVRMDNVAVDLTRGIFLSILLLFSYDLLDN